MAASTVSHEEHYVNYMAIFWWLLVLTILEVFAGYPAAGAAYTQTMKGALLVVMAVAKAALVAMYFMHLRFEKLTLAFIAMIPLVLCVFIVIITMPDF